MFRLLVILVTAAVCVAAFASVFQWPLSPANFDEASSLGIRWGAGGALFAALWLAQIDRKYLGRCAVLAVVATWLVTFVAVWLSVISSLG